MYDIVKALVLPPASLILILSLGLAIMTVRRRWGVAITTAGVALFYLLSTPLVAHQLSQAVQTVPPLAAEAPAGNAQAIVVLAAGIMPFAPEYNGSIIDGTTLQRLAYAATLWRRYQLPVLVSGGIVLKGKPPVADLMRNALEESFGVPVSWVENTSADTFENATFSARILRAEDISRILLVTHAAHMPRSLELFRNTGLDVTPAPTIFTTPYGGFPRNLVPRESALQDSYYAVYELIGTGWYALRGKTTVHP